MNSPATARPDRVVVVDDDARIRDLLRRYLTQEGFEVLLAEDAKALNRLLTRETIDLIVLDLMLPGEDGLSICRRLRAANDVTPIIMLTAKVEDVDRIVGLEVGADDYLPKPFNPRELLARIHAVLRRRPAMEAPGAPAKEAQVVTFGPFEFDLSLRRLTKDGEQIALTTGEFSMLKALVRHPRQPLSRDKLAQLARGREFEPFDRSLDVQISRLRKMIEPDPAQPRYIQTVWGVGYVFVPDGTADVDRRGLRHHRAAMPRAIASALSLFWRTFFLLALLLAGGIFAWVQTLARARVRAARGAGGAADRQPGEPVARRAALRRQHQPRRAGQDHDRPGIDARAAARAGRPLGAVRGRPLHTPRRRRAALATRIPTRWWPAPSTAQPGLWVGFSIEKDPYWLQADATRVVPLTPEHLVRLGRHRAAGHAARLGGDRAADQPAAARPVVRRQPHPRRRVRFACSTRTR